MSRNLIVSIAMPVIALAIVGCGSRAVTSTQGNGDQAAVYETRSAEEIANDKRLAALLLEQGNGGAAQTVPADQQAAMDDIQALKDEIVAVRKDLCVANLGKVVDIVGERGRADFRCELPHYGESAQRPTLDKTKIAALQAKLKDLVSRQGAAIAALEQLKGATCAQVSNKEGGGSHFECTYPNKVGDEGGQAPSGQAGGGAAKGEGGSGVVNPPSGNGGGEGGQNAAANPLPAAQSGGHE